jgi:hypothetical protein
VFAESYNQCSDKPMGTYITPTPYFVDAYLDQLAAKESDSGNDDWATPDASQYTQCTQVEIQNTIVSTKMVHATFRWAEGYLPSCDRSHSFICSHNYLHEYISIGSKSDVQTMIASHSRSIFTVTIHVRREAWLMVMMTPTLISLRSR